MKKSEDKGFWSGVADTVIFQPNKSGRLAIWKDGYRLNRALKEMERDLRYPPKKIQRSWWQSVLHWMWRQLRDAWYEFYDEVRALITELFIFLVGFFVTLACYVALGWLLFWVIGLLLDG